MQNILDEQQIDRIVEIGWENRHSIWIAIAFSIKLWSEQERTWNHAKRDETGF